MRLTDRITPDISKDLYNQNMNSLYKLSLAESFNLGIYMSVKCTMEEVIPLN